MAHYASKCTMGAIVRHQWAAERLYHLFHILSRQRKCCHLTLKYSFSLLVPKFHRAENSILHINSKLFLDFGDSNIFFRVISYETPCRWQETLLVVDSSRKCHGQARRRQCSCSRIDGTFKFLCSTVAGKEVVDKKEMETLPWVHVQSCKLEWTGP